MCLHVRGRKINDSELPVVLEVSVRGYMEWKPLLIDDLVHGRSVWIIYILTMGKGKVIL